MKHKHAAEPPHTHFMMQIIYQVNMSSSSTPNTSALAEVTRNLLSLPEFQTKTQATTHLPTLPSALERSQQIAKSAENIPVGATLPSSFPSQQAQVGAQGHRASWSAHSTPVARKRPRSRSTVSAASPSVDYAALNGLGAGSPKYVAACFPANSPCEDRHFFVYDADKDASVFGVLDGHGGDACSEHAVNFLPDAVLSSLSRAGGKAQCRTALTAALAECEAAWLEHLKRTACMGQETAPAMSICEQDAVCRDLEARAAAATAPGRRPRLPAGYWYHRLEQKQAQRLAKSGACATIGIIKNGFVVLAHVGDTRAVLATRCASRARASVKASSNLVLVHHTAENAADASKFWAQDDAPADAHVFSEVARHMAGRSDHLRPSAADKLLARGNLPCAASGTDLCEELGIHAVALTEDHTHNSEQERLAVQLRQTLRRKPAATASGVVGAARRRAGDVDGKPFRRSQRELDAGFDGGPLRVAGLVSMTRALGDVYLKHVDWSTPYTRCAPYITAVPQVTSHPLSEADAFLVLGSDGIFDRLTNQDVVDAAVASSLPECLHMGGVPSAGSQVSTVPMLHRGMSVGGVSRGGSLLPGHPSLLSQPLGGRRGGNNNNPHSPAARPRPSKLARSSSEPAVSRSAARVSGAGGSFPPSSLGQLALGEGLPNGIGLTSAHMGRGELTPRPADDDVHSIASSWVSNLETRPPPSASQVQGGRLLGNSASDRILLASLQAAASVTRQPLRQLLWGGAFQRRREIHDDLTALVVLLPSAHGALLEAANRPRQQGTLQQRSIRDFVHTGVCPAPLPPVAAAAAVGGTGSRRRRGGAAQVQRAREIADAMHIPAQVVEGADDSEKQRV